MPGTSFRFDQASVDDYHPGYCNGAVGLERPHVGRRGKQRDAEDEPRSAPPTLAQSGVDKKLSARAQTGRGASRGRLAAVKGDGFRAAGNREKGMG
jgi:hypothetical protein